MRTFYGKATLICCVMLIAACAATTAKIPIDSSSANPGAMVAIRGEAKHLQGTPLQVGGTLPEIPLIDSFSMKKVDLSQFKGKVLLISLVPSIDTKVCEAQTHSLADIGSRLPEVVQRITISRDTPFAQKRFAEEAKLSGIIFLSDYRDGSFGRSNGLLLEDSMLLARAVILADRDGIVRYIQVVPEQSHLPDLETALLKARALAGIQ